MKKKLLRLVVVLCCLLTNRVADNGKPTVTLQLQCKCENNCSAQIDLFLQKLYKFPLPKKIRFQESNFYGQGGVSRKSRYLYYPVILYKQTTSCKDLLITKKIELIFYSIMESISQLGKMARTSANFR